MPKDTSIKSVLIIGSGPIIIGQAAEFDYSGTQAARSLREAATADVRSLLYIAEVYWDLEWTLQQQGFQFTYDKRLLDRLHGAPPAEIRAHLLAQDVTDGSFVHWSFS